MRASWERLWTLFAAVVIAVVSSVAMPAAVHAAQLGYTGGPVIVNPHIYIDYWGPEWASTTPDTYGYTPAQAKNYVQSFLQHIGGSYSLGVLTQYYQWPLGGVQTFITNPTGQFNPATDIYADTRSVPSPFYRSDITLEAAAYADAHFQAHTDFDRVYLILTGPGKTPQDLTQPPDTQDCAYHSYTQSNGHLIAFAYVPWWQSTSQNCFVKAWNYTSPQPVGDSFGHGPFDAFSINIIHEYAEAITDPEVGQSWSVPGTDTNPQEIGDECRTYLGNTWVGSQYYAMQGLWANGTGSCFLAKGDTPSPYPTCSTPTLTASPPSAQVAGANVTFTGATSVCPSPSYRFWVRPPGGAWSVVRDYDPNWNFVWNAGAATGTYNIEVDVRDATSSVAYDATATMVYQVNGCTSATLAVSNGAPVTLRASASCPGTPNYRFWIQPPSGNWTMVQDYSTSSTYSWNTSGLAAGTYGLDVWVRDQGATSSYETYAYTTYVVVAPTPIVVDNGTYTFVGDHNHLRKYSDGGYGANFLSGSDLSGLTGPGCPTGSSSYACLGYEDMGATITALAINNQYLYIGLSTGRVIKTNMCGSGGNVCAFSDNMGSGPYPGYSYWIGEMDLAGPISALAVNSNYLYTSFGTRTVKTTLCGSGGNVCALGNNGGTAGLSGYNYWVGYQDWSWPVVAQAANDSYVFTSLSGGPSGPNRVCKTNLGSTGGDVFWLYPTGQPEDCTGGLSGFYYGYQDMSEPVVGLSADQRFVWWSLGGSLPRLVQTNFCSTGANVCSFSDGYGSSGGSWIGLQDWCTGYTAATVSSWTYYDHPVYRSLVNVIVTTGSGYWRIVKASDNTGVNTLATSDCTGTAGNPSYPYWIGFQDFNF